MTIKVGDKIPEVTLKRLTAEGMSEVNTTEFFKGRKVVLVGVPAAFSPTCSKEHLPGYIARADELKASGVDEIVCLAVNDPFAMKAWGDQQGAEGKVTLLPDGNGEFTRAMGMELDLSVVGLGIRGRRYSMVIEDGVVKTINIEEGKGVSVSGADVCLVGA